MKKVFSSPKLLLAVLLICLPLISFAGNAYGHDKPPADGAPLDGGLSILLAAGVGYGAKMLSAKRKKA
ncbi:MAG TPA: hypothetical protein VN721_16575 [Flavipsychrobacter sp.]|nr:hypothetical protein [Flavipsychrobacter sp.]